MGGGGGVGNIIGSPLGEMGRLGCSLSPTGVGRRVQTSCRVSVCSSFSAVMSIFLGREEDMGGLGGWVGFLWCQV